MKLILVGAPAAGKGTVSVPLKEKLGIPTVSTGDLLRDAVAKQTPEGVMAKKYMDEGQLVLQLFGMGQLYHGLPQCLCLRIYM